MWGRRVLLFCFLPALLGVPISLHASADYTPGLELRHDVYDGESEEIHILALTLVNTGTRALYNLEIVLAPPDGPFLSSYQATEPLTVDIIMPGESMVLNSEIIMNHPFEAALLNSKEIAWAIHYATEDAQVLTQVMYSHAPVAGGAQ